MRVGNLKIFFLLLFSVLFICNVSGQVRYDNFTLNEALKKAKSEKKMVLMLGTSSTSKQTQKIENNCFTSNELAKYIESKFIFIRCNFDINNNQAIADRYDVIAYPSLLIIGGDGVEISRTQGAPRDAETFISNVEKALKEENRWAYHETKFKANPKEYGMRYHEILNSNYRYKRSKEVFAEQFKLHTVEENFSEINMYTYNNNVREMDDFIIQYMINNPSEVSSVIGEEVFDKFISTKVSRYIELAMLRAKSVEQLEEKLAIIHKTKSLQTESYHYINNNRVILVNRSAEEILDAVNNTLESVSLLEMYNIVRGSVYAAQRDKRFNKVKAEYVTMLRKAKELDVRNSERYDEFINKFVDKKSGGSEQSDVVRITIKD